MVEILIHRITGIIALIASITSLYFIYSAVKKTEKGIFKTGFLSVLIGLVSLFILIVLLNFVDYFILPEDATNLTLDILVAITAIMIAWGASKIEFGIEFIPASFYKVINRSL